MKIVDTYSFRNGESFLKKNHPLELRDIVDAIESLDACLCLTKKSREKTMKGKLLFSPVDMNNLLKLFLHEKGWTDKASGKRKNYIEPRLYFGGGRFREMDGIKNKVGLEIQFGKYAFMGYDIFSKMIIFKNLRQIECGVEIVPTSHFVKHMSTGVSSFDQLRIDFENRGESNIDIPVYVIGIGLTDKEEGESERKRNLFLNGTNNFVKKLKLRRNRGVRPGPK